MVGLERVTAVEEGAWVSEAALWSHWIHVGKLEAEAGCQLMTVSATDLLQILPRRTLIGYMSRYYGRSFHVRLINATPPHASWPSDLLVSFCNPVDLLPQEMGLGILRQALQD